MSKVAEYEKLAMFMLQVTSLPESTAEVERTFSEVNSNKTKLRNCLATGTLKAFIQTSEFSPIQVIAGFL